MKIVLSLGYYHYMIDKELAEALQAAQLRQAIKTCEKKFIDGEHRVVEGKNLDIEISMLEEITATESKIAILEQQLAALKKATE